MRSADPPANALAPGSAALRRARRRGPQIYRALIAFDLLTIMVTLLLGNHIMSGYERSVGQSVAWSARVVMLAGLMERAQEANAPANDVFRSLDVAQERLRRDAAMHGYVREHAALMDELSREVDQGARRYLERRVARADAEMRTMTRQTEAIFIAYERGDHARASSQMAEMDRTYGRLSHHLRDAINAVQAIEDRNLAQQVSIAKSLNVLGLVVLALILLIIVGLAAYGRYLSRILHSAAETHDAMLLELAAANQALEHYADNVAHELRSPINKILVHAEVMLSRPRAKAEYQEALASVMEDAQDLSGIVSSLLFLARAQRGGVDLQSQRLELGAQLELIRSYFEATAQQALVQLTVDCPPGVVLHADRGLLQRALGNLVANAIRHTAPGGSVTLSVAAGPGEVTIYVIDTGEGMPAHVQARVFERFYRADAAPLAGGERVGLGLPIAKSIVDLHGGRISIASSPNCGTTVAIRLQAPPYADVIAA